MSLTPKYDFCLVEGENEALFKKNIFSFEMGSFSLMLPPPNITGDLHLGHAYEVIIQDFIIRLEFLRGKRVNWIVGLDHAGIATQRVIERISSLQTPEEKNKFTLNDWFPRVCYKFLEQWRSLGVVIDKDSILFTLDDLAQKQVRRAFVELYNKGFIYRDNRLVYWDKQLKSVISDIEVESRVVANNLYYLKYWLYDEDKTKKKKYILVATSRPETIFADVAVFVNPLDKRYWALTSRKLINPCGLVIPLLKDEEIQINFGSGAMKCTPAHDVFDYNLAKKHNLSFFSCCDEEGVLNDLAGEWCGKKIWKIRNLLLNKLNSEGFLEKTESYKTSLIYSIQTDEIVETILSRQWFLDLPKLIKEAEKILPNFLDKITFFPDFYHKKIKEWGAKAEKWCLSRQLWWGHKIPAWHNKKTGDVYVGEYLCSCEETKETLDHFHRSADEWEATTDVLDTWFSSGLWPLISSSKMGDFPSPTLFPIDILVTGYDILFFWVFKMIVLGVYFKRNIPFRRICLHGLVRDVNKKKMSKSLGNGINPQEIISRYGCDSLRLFFCKQNVWGEDLIYRENKVEESWNFCQKLWSITNFIIKKVPLSRIRKLIDTDVKL